jgi:putative phage-type endonuclease
MIIIEACEQGSAEWHKLRLGRITASKMKDVLSKGRGTAPSKAAETYMMELLAERLTGEPKPFFENDAMRWGTETEPQARSMYELKSGNTVKEVSFIAEGEHLGVSPDGLIGDDGMLEIKCPTTITQIRRALTDNYSKDYYEQIQMQLWIAGRKWCDFLSFDPRLDVDAGYLLQRVERDEEFINNMAEKSELLVAKMNELYIKLTKEEE